MFISKHCLLKAQVKKEGQTYSIHRTTATSVQCLLTEIYTPAETHAIIKKAVYTAQ